MPFFFFLEIRHQNPSIAEAIVSSWASPASMIACIRARLQRGGQQPYCLHPGPFWDRSLTSISSAAAHNNQLDTRHVILLYVSDESSRDILSPGTQVGCVVCTMQYILHSSTYDVAVSGHSWIKTWRSVFCNLWYCRDKVNTDTNRAPYQNWRNRKKAKKPHYLLVLNTRRTRQSVPGLAWIEHVIFNPTSLYS